MQGKVVGHYFVGERLGAGAMGVVHKARDIRTDRLVALKLLPPTLVSVPSAREQLLKEGTAASLIDHPNVGTIYEVDESSDGELYLAMAYYEGQTLAERQRRDPLSLDDALEVATDVAKGLAAAHRRGVTHGDIKPENLMLTVDGVVKVIDFGVATIRDVTTVVDLESVRGTLPYLAPERLSGRPPEPRCDIWSFGVVLYELVAGQGPFAGNDSQAIAAAIRTASYRPLRSAVTGLPVGLDELVSSMLTVDPDSRCQTLEAAIDQLAMLATIRREAQGPGSAIGNARAITVAVLPFVAISEDAAAVLICEGIVSNLCASLGGLQDVSVLSLTSASRFRNVEIDVRQIGKELSADLVLEGRVRLVAGRVRVTVQLITVSDGAQIWTERYDPSERDPLIVEDEVSHLIADRVKAQLKQRYSLSLSKRSTDDFEAYRLYLAGRHYCDRPNPESLRLASSSFEAAIQRDPSFFLPYAGLADCRIYQGFLGLVRVADAFSEARVLADMATQLNAIGCESLTTQAMIGLFHDWNWEGTEHLLIQAITLYPDEGLPRALYSILLALRGRKEEAVLQLEKARSLPDQSPLVAYYCALAHLVAGDHAAAKAICHWILARDTGFTLAKWVICLADLRGGRLDEACTLAAGLVGETDHQSFFVALGGMAMAHARQDATVDALFELRHRSHTEFIPSIYSAQIYAALGDAETALDLMDQAVDERSPLLLLVTTLACYDSILQHPRFLAVIARIGLVATP